LVTIEDISDNEKDVQLEFFEEEKKEESIEPTKSQMREDDQKKEFMKIKKISDQP